MSADRPAEKDRRDEEPVGGRGTDEAPPSSGDDPPRDHRFSGDDESKEGAAGASEARTPGMGS